MWCQVLIKGHPYEGELLEVNLGKAHVIVDGKTHTVPVRDIFQARIKYAAPDCRHTAIVNQLPTGTLVCAFCGVPVGLA